MQHYLWTQEVIKYKLLHVTKLGLRGVAKSFSSLCKRSVALLPAHWPCGKVSPLHNQCWSFTCWSGYTGGKKLCNMTAVIVVFAVWPFCVCCIIQYLPVQQTQREEMKGINGGDRHRVFRLHFSSLCQLKTLMTTMHLFWLFNFIPMITKALIR